MSDARVWGDARWDQKPETFIFALEVVFLSNLKQTTS